MNILDDFVVPTEPAIEQPRPLEDRALLIPDSVKVIPEVAKRLHGADKLSFPIFIDNSAREAYSLCKYKGFISHLRHIVPISSNIHLHFGGAMAKGLETVRKSFYSGARSLEAAVEDGLVAMWKEWGDYEPNPDYKGPKTIDRLECALIAYFDHWNPETDHLQPYIFNDKPAVEFTFAVPIPDVYHPETGEPMLYVGRFDMLAQLTTGGYKGGLFVDDEKTSTSLGQSWASQWDISPQMTGYVWAAKQYGLPVLGAMVRGIGILKNEIKLADKLTMRSQWQIDAWLAALQRTVREMIVCWQNDEWPQVFNAACNLYGGCPNRLLCSHSDPEAWMQGNYRTHVWDPLDKE